MNAEADRQPIVLLADDDEQLSEMILYLLRGRGYQAVHAVDGDMAIRMITDFQPDLLLLDLDMPKKNGFEVLKFLKTNNVFKNVRVIMFTKLSESENFLKANQMGADAYMCKPIETDDLLTTVKVLLKRRSPAA